MAYPPDDHVLRDLRVTSWLEAETHAAAEMPVDAAVLDAGGGASLGALTTLVDLCCARVAFFAADPHWIATADLSLHLGRPVGDGETVRCDVRLLKAGSKLISLGIDLGGAGRGVASFARIPRAASLVQDRLPTAIGERTSMPLVGPAPSRPIVERMGMRPIDGGVELDKHPYVGNSFGTINGGVLGFLVTAAAERVAGGVGTGLTLRYHGQTKAGPARAVASPIRDGLCEVRVVDAGAGEQLLATAFVATAPAAG